MQLKFTSVTFWSALNTWVHISIQFKVDFPPIKLSINSLHFAGFAGSYFGWQITIWMLLFTVVLVWGVRHPFSYRKLKALGRVRYAHIICVTLAVFGPLPSSLVILVDGYSITNENPYTCVGRSLDFSYYAFLFPVSIMQACTTFILVVIFWTLFKEFVLKKLLQGKKTVNVMGGQLKITILIVYTIIHTALATILSVYFNRTQESQDNFKDYIICERMGTMSDCVLDDSTQVTISNAFSAARTMLNLSPLVILFISCDLKCCCKRSKVTATQCWTKWWIKRYMHGDTQRLTLAPDYDA